MLKQWEKLPDIMRTPEVAKYYRILKKKPLSLFFKRLFDILFSLILIVLLSPLMLFITIWIKCDSKGPVMFRQIRITTAGKEFRIFKFRTMVVDVENPEQYITRVGKFLRAHSLDELPQLFNVLAGDMSFVGTRPEVPHYVEQYTPEMWATLLLPAGITSEASIEYKDEDRLLEGAEDVDRVYMEEVLPEKMKYNLRYLERFQVLRDFVIMIETVIAVLK
mgnify:CR=1 FL=1